MKEQTHLPNRRRPVIWDRQATLGAIDRRAMVALADELLGAHRGTDRSPVWPCPSHDRQTGRTPPVSIFADRLGDQRWKCHSCGTGGTAVDLVMQARGMSVRDALGELARRTGTPPLGPGRRPLGRSRSSSSARPMASVQALDPLRRRPVPGLDRYVAECADALWRPEGRAARGWLVDARGLPERVLRANRIGADLGPSSQDRPDGVPAVRRAVVLPVLVDGGACFVQLRTLGRAPGFPKYLNTRESLAPNPRLAVVAPAPPAGDAVQREILVTEGFFDALSAAGAGYRAVAFLSAGYPDRIAAVILARLGGPLVVAFDPDRAGQAGAQRLVELLAAQRREAAVLRLTKGDLNDNAARSQDWPVELAARVEHATYPLTRLPPTLVHG